MDLIRTELINNFSPVVDDATRLFHGRGRCFAGHEFLTIDYFNPVVEIVLYAPKEKSWLNELVQLLLSVLEESVDCIVLLEKYRMNSVPVVLWGELPAQNIAREDGLCYGLDLRKGQNAGLFLDMRNGRSLVKRLAKGKKVLNLFAYTCSFSVAALSGGASQVVNLDMSRQALNRGRVNHQLNGIDLRNVSFLAHELFRSFSKLKRLAPFDLVIVDPPTYQGKSFQVERDYPKLLSKIPALLAPNAELICCLNAPHLGEDFLLKTLRKTVGGELIETLERVSTFPECKDLKKGVDVVRWRV